MKITGSVDLDVLQQHEAATGANVRLGGYGMADQVAPVEEFRIFGSVLDTDDIDRLFLLGCFAAHTERGACWLKGVLPRMASCERVAKFSGHTFDPRSRPDRAILMVSVNERTYPLVIYDGNHRAIAHYLRHNSVRDVPAFVSVHARISLWRYVPSAARVAAKWTW